MISNRLQLDGGMGDKKPLFTAALKYRLSNPFQRPQLETVVTREDIKISRNNILISFSPYFHFDLAVYIKNKPDTFDG